MSPEWVSATAAATIALTGLVGVVVAGYQLKRLNSTLRLNGLLGVVQLESEINKRRSRLVDVGQQIILEGGKAKSNQDKKLLASLEERLKVDTEAYLNSVDRLAFCILKDYFPEREWRTEYRDFIATDVSDHEEYFRANTRYDNMLKLHNKWKAM